MRSFRLSAAAALVLGFFAMPALTAAEPVVLEGTNWTLQGRSKAKVNRLGSDRDDETVSISFGEGLTWTAVDDEANEASGTYVTRGARANKFDATIDGATETATEAWIADWIEGALADAGEPSAVEVDLLSSKVKGNVVKGGTLLKVRIHYKFFATATDLGKSSKGQYKVTLRGGQDAP